MRYFTELYERAARRHGGAEAMESRITEPRSAADIAAIGDDRWLSQMSMNVFQAGFVWRVVENKWPAFEQAFSGFDPYVVAHLSDDDMGKLVRDTALIRHHRKLQAVRANATFILDLAQAHGSAGAFFATQEPGRYVDLLGVLKKRASRMGGTSAQYFLRRMGVDSFILSRDVVAVLMDEGVVVRAPSSKRDLEAVQSAFNTWREESGRSLTAVSRVLAMSID